MWFITVTNATVTVIVFFHGNVTTVITAVKLPREALEFLNLHSHDKIYFSICLKKNQNAPRPSEHPPVRGKKCQNV